jgi:hypothetical protein
MSGFSKVQMSVFPQDNPITDGFGSGHGQDRSNYDDDARIGPSKDHPGSRRW